MPTAGAPRPSVTVSILAFRSGDTSPGCLQSVLAADYDGDIDVVVREQGGSDDECAALQTIAREAQAPVRIEQGTNLGFSGGHNRAFRRSAASLFLALNADARLDTGYLRAAVAAFDSPAVGAVQGLVLRDGADRVIDATGLEPHRSRRVVARRQGERLAEPAEPAEVWGVDGAVALFRRAALVDVAHPGGEVFDEDFFAYKEDVDLAWRLRRRGWSTRFVPDAVAWHRRSARGAAGGGVRLLLAERRAVPAVAHESGFVNQRLAQIKNEQWRSLAPALGPWLGRELIAWSLALVRWEGFGRIILRLLRGVPGAWRRRRWVQQRALVNDDVHWFH